MISSTEQDLSPDPKILDIFTLTLKRPGSLVVPGIEGARGEDGISERLDSRKHGGSSDMCNCKTGRGVRREPNMVTN